MKHIIKEFLQTLIRNVECFGLQPEDTKTASGKQQRNAGRMFTINIHCFAAKRWLLNDGNQYQVSSGRAMQDISNASMTSFSVNQIFRHKYMQLTPKKGLGQSYSIMAGGVFT